MKISKITLSILTMIYLSACGGAGNTGGNSPTPPTGSTSETNITSEVSALLETHCSQRPSRSTINATHNGQEFRYTEALAEQDIGHQITSGTHLLSTNKIGTLVLKPSTDGNVSWGARQWVLAPSQSEADAALHNITITSQVVSDEAKVLVDHPNSQIPGNRYEVCLVVMAPAAWIAQLENDSGDIISENHSGAITLHNGSGDITVIQNGPGFMTATNDSGNITATGDSRGGATLTTQSGAVHYTLNNGDVALQNASRLQTDSGSIILTLQDGFGINLTATTTTGSITVPGDFPSPIPNGTTGEHFEAQANDGGAVLTIQSDTGGVIIGGF